ncbi:MAG: hypothetical protein HC927_00230 [Deltaproteobacteria bacterium]|nr:hypothetical protein [Deltaproteobacteria bacterium]
MALSEATNLLAGRQLDQLKTRLTIEALETDHIIQVRREVLKDYARGQLHLLPTVLEALVVVNTLCEGELTRRGVEFDY